MSASTHNHSLMHAVCVLTGNVSQCDNLGSLAHASTTPVCASHSGSGTVQSPLLFAACILPKAQAKLSFMSALTNCRVAVTFVPEVCDVVVC